MAIVKVEFAPGHSAAIMSQGGGTWHDMRIVETFPDSPHALIEMPDEWDQESIDAWMQARWIEGELVDDGNIDPVTGTGLWRYMHDDYFAQGVFVPDFIGPKAIGDAFPPHSLDDAEIIRLGKGGQGVCAIVVDTGINTVHPCFQGVRVVGEGLGRDSHGHGTHVASTMASKIGVAPNCVIYAAWGLPRAGGGGTEADITAAVRAGVDFAIREGLIPVVNASLGGRASSLLDAGFEYAKARGAVVVVACGNSGGSPSPGSPARVADIQAASCSRTGFRSSFSDGYLWPDTSRVVAAVGENLEAAGRDGGTAVMTGTSMASPIEAGACCLLAGAGYKREAVVEYMLSHRLELPAAGGRNLRFRMKRDFGAVTPPPPPEDKPGAPYFKRRTWVEWNELSDGSKYPVEWVATATPPPGRASELVTLAYKPHSTVEVLNAYGHPVLVPWLILPSDATPDQRPLWQANPQSWPTADPHPLVLRAARKAIELWRPAEAALMVAIQIAESWLVDDARGDHLTRTPGWTEAQRRAWAPYADADGYLSHGWGQVFLGVHSSMIKTQYGAPAHALPNDAQARWLHDPDNNLKACQWILTNQGPDAWSAYKVKAHEQFLAHAHLAVDRALLERDANKPEPKPRHWVHIQGVFKGTLIGRYHGNMVDNLGNVESFDIPDFGGQVEIPNMRGSVLPPPEVK